MFFSVISSHSVFGRNICLRSNIFPSPIDVQIIIQVFQSCKPDSLDVCNIYLPDIKALHIRVLCCSFSYRQHLRKFCNHQIVVGIADSRSTNRTSGFHDYRFLLEPHQSLCLQVHLYIFADVDRCTLDSWIFWCGKVYYSNLIIITTRISRKVSFPILLDDWR
jgi:hypothetical protein